MEFEELKRAIAALPPDEQRELIRFLLSRRTTDEERAKYRRMIDDNDPARWLTLEQLDAKLAELEERERNGTA